jgi:hypothetical protein
MMLADAVDKFAAAQLKTKNLNCYQEMFCKWQIVITTAAAALPAAVNGKTRRPLKNRPIKKVISKK